MVSDMPEEKPRAENPFHIEASHRGILQITKATKRHKSWIKYGDKHSFAAPKLDKM